MAIAGFPEQCLVCVSVMAASMIHWIAVALLFVYRACSACTVSSIASLGRYMSCAALIVRGNQGFAHSMHAAGPAMCELDSEVVIEHIWRRIQISIDTSWAASSVGSASVVCFRETRFQHTRPHAIHLNTNTTFCSSTLQTVGCRIWPISKQVYVCACVRVCMCVCVYVHVYACT
jgi:hypothetical protein